MQFPFGKFKGQDVDCTPTEYLKWFEENVTCSIQLREEIQKELKIRHSEDNQGRIVANESPRVVSFEELLFIEIVKWIGDEIAAQRILIPLVAKETCQKSLTHMLKTEVPRLRKLYRE
jgi:uncharacterized protein (DUF3820 family)